MKNIIRKIALLLVPMVLYFGWFAAFEPNNYFGLRKAATGTAPIARVRAYQQDPGQNLMLGDSRFAHFDMDAVAAQTGESWQNLAFGGASLRECLDLADYILDSGEQPDTILFELSFYTLNAGYDTDRFTALEETLRNPLAYCFNLEYNVNALTCFMDWLRGTPDTIESGDWVAEDYFDAAGNPIPLHRLLYDYTATITPRCRNWSVNEAQLQRLEILAQRCQSIGIRFILVLPPMAQNVRSEVCDVFGITPVMEDDILPRLQQMAEAYSFTLLDYEWAGSCIENDDTQFFDGFHLDEKYGLPDWTSQLCADIAQ